MKEPYKITVKSPYGITLSYELPCDADLDDWKIVFKSLLIGLTYHEDTVKEMFNEEC